MENPTGSQAPHRDKPQETADGILEALEYLVREAHGADMPHLAKAITRVIMDPESWADLRR